MAGMPAQGRRRRYSRAFVVADDPPDVGLGCCCGVCGVANAGGIAGCSGRRIQRGS
jgi:hypothetical protein